MSNNLLYFNVKHWISVCVTNLFLLGKFFNYQVSGQIVENNSLNATASYNATPSNINNYSYVRDNYSSWGIMAVVCFTLGLLLTTLNNYIAESNEYNDFKNMKKTENEEREEEPLGLAAVKNQIKKDFDKLSVDLVNQNSLRNFLKENSSAGSTQLEKQLQLAAKFDEHYQKGSDAIIAISSTRWAPKYSFYSNSFYALSVLLDGLTTAESFLNWQPYISLSLVFINLCIQINGYHNMHKPTKALSQHIAELKQLDRTIKKEIVELLHERSHTLHEEAREFQRNTTEVMQELNVVSERIHSIHASLFRATREEIEKEDREPQMAIKQTSV